MKTITLRTMAAFGMALLGGIALIIDLAVGLNVLTWLRLGILRRARRACRLGGDPCSALGDLPRRVRIRIRRRAASRIYALWRGASLREPLSTPIAIMF